MTPLQSSSTPASGTPGTTQSAAYPDPLSSGTTLVAVVAVAGRTVHANSVTDGLGGQLASLGAIGNLSSPGCSVSLWAVPTPAAYAGDTPTLTAHLSGSAEASILIQEVPGLDLAAGTAMCDGPPQGASGAGGTSTRSPNYSSTAAGEDLVCVYGDSGGATWTVPAGMTADPASINGNTHCNVAAAYGSSSGGPETETWGLSAPGAWAVLLGAFRSA